MLRVTSIGAYDSDFNRYCFSRVSGLSSIVRALLRKLQQPQVSGYVDATETESYCLMWICCFEIIFMQRQIGSYSPTTQ